MRHKSQRQQVAVVWFLLSASNDTATHRAVTVTSLRRDLDVPSGYRRREHGFHLDVVACRRTRSVEGRTAVDICESSALRAV